MQGKPKISKIVHFIRREKSNIYTFVVIKLNILFFSPNYINLVVGITVPKAQKIIGGIEVGIEVDQCKNVVPFTSILDLVESTYSMLKKCLPAGM